MNRMGSSWEVTGGRIASRNWFDAPGRPDWSGLASEPRRAHSQRVGSRRAAGKDATMPDQANTRMRLERFFAAPPAKVYRAFTDPDQLAEWFGPLGFHVPRSSVRVDARAGGFWHLVMVGNENPAITSPVDSVFTEVVENVRLVSYEDARGMPGVRDGTRLVLTIEFTPDGDGTRLVIDQGPFPARLSESGAAGWRQSFGKLDALLETPADLHTPAAG
jgi:uncharacterized protein YndB with AHSA1/START domain